MILFLLFIIMCVAVVLQLYCLKAFHNIQITKNSSKNVYMALKTLGLITIGISIASWLAIFITAFANSTTNVLSLFEDYGYLGIINTVSGVIDIAYFVLFLVLICSKDNNNLSSNKSLKTDILLCTFLGFLGIHRFYEKKNKSALAWLLVAIVPSFVFMIIAILSIFVDIPDGLFITFLVLFIVSAVAIAAMWLVDWFSMISLNRVDGDGNFIIRWNAEEEVDLNKVITSVEIQNSLPETKLPKFIQKTSPSVFIYLAFIVIFFVGGLSVFLQ